MSDEIVVWNEKYATGIGIIDKQHLQLVKLTNELYRACVARNDTLQKAFKEAMSRMVDYVKFHFTAENKLLEAIEYPDWENHKKMHDTLIKKILDTVNEYNQGKLFVPNNFVRSLVDWVFSHIAFYDKQYSYFAAEKIKSGELTKERLKEIEKSIA